MLNVLAGRLLQRFVNPSVAAPETQQTPEDPTKLPRELSGFVRRQRAFVTSTGRAGTHFVAHYLNQNRLVPATHQPQPDGLDIGNGYARGQIGAAQVVDWLRRRDFGEVVEVTPFFFSLLGPIRQLWPAARLAVIVRHPLGYAFSAYRHWGGWYKGPEDHKLRVRAIDFPQDPYRDAWAELTRAEKVAWLWRYQNMVMCRDLPPDGLLVRFEDIFTPPFSGMARLLEFLGLEPEVDADTMGVVVEGSEPEGETVDAGEHASMMRIAGDWDWKSDPRVFAAMAPYFMEEETP